MKKFLAIFMLCFAVFAAKAQVFLLQESFDDGTIPADWVAFDADGDGYNWGADADADYEDEGYSHTGMGMAYSASYVNYVGAINTDHWLITNAITIPSTATAPTLTWWTKSAYADEYEVYVSTTGNSVSDFGTTPLVPSTVASTSYTQGTQSLNDYIGQTIYIAFRHHFTDGYYLFLDDIEVYCTLTEPLLYAQSSSMDFGTVITGRMAQKSTTVSTYNLTEGITVSTASPFSVSLDGETFAASVTMPTTGGTLYVQYAPTAIGTNNGIVVLVSGDLSDTITLVGESMECNTITDYPYTCDFTDAEQNLCWTIEDANEDGFTFTLGETTYYNYNEDNDADDWLISPEFQLTGHEYVAFDYRAYGGTTYPEKLEVAIIQGEDTTTIVEEFTVSNSSFQTLGVNLSNYTGNYQIGIHCTSDANMSALIIANFLVSDESTIAADEDEIDFGTLRVADEDTVKDYVTVTTIMVSEAVEVATAAPFLVSLDDSVYTTSLTIPADTNLMNETLVYVAFAPTAGGEFEGMVTFTDGTATDTVLLKGVGVECNTITEFPYQTNFTNEAKNLCWTIENANEDDYTWQFNTSDASASIRWNEDIAADDWLISPEFTLTGNEYLAFDYRVAGSSFPEKFQIYLIQGADSTILIDTITATNTSYLTKVQDLRADTGNYQIGIRYISEANMYRLYITNFLVASAEEILAADPDSIGFGIIIVDEYATETVTLTTLNVMEAIEVTTEAPFSISLNDTTYTTSLTIPASDEFSRTIPVYVKYAPDTVEENSGMITFYTQTLMAELTDTVLLAGEGFECNTVAEFPYFTDFSDTYKNLCWRINDANNDGSTFEFDDEDGAYYGYDDDNAADDWLISPEFNLTGAEYVGFDYFVGWARYPEKFSVHLLRDTVDIVLLPTATYTNEDPETMLLALDAYTGPCRIAIHAESNADMYGLYITNFMIDSIANLDESLTVNPTSIDFGSVIYSQGVTATEMAMVTAVVVPDSLTVTTAAPFAVSLDGTTFVDSLIIPAAAISHTNLYVQYAPDTFGTHTGIVTISGDTLTATIALSATALDCSDNIGTLPFNEDFEGGVFPPTCWYIESTNNVTWESKVSENDNSTWAYCNYAETGLQDEKLITKTIDFTTDQTDVTMTFDFIASYYYVTNTDPAEQYNLLIYASTDNGATFSSTPLYDMRNDQEEFENWAITSATVDLSSLIGQTNVKLMFNYYGNYGAEMWIDNINITAGTVGIEEETAENPVFIYPNPASTMLNVHAENYRTVQIVNFLGQVVYSSNVTENDFQINVSNLSNGVYFIRLNGENTVTKKFVKR